MWETNAWNEAVLKVNLYKIKGVHVAEAHTEVLWLSYIWILRKYLNLILTFVQVPKFWFIFVILYALLLLVQCNLPYCSPKIFSFTSMFLSQSGKHYENNRNGKYMPFFNLGEIFGPGCKIQPKKLWFFFPLAQILINLIKCMNFALAHLFKWQ